MRIKGGKKLKVPTFFKFFRKNILQFTKSSVYLQSEIKQVTEHEKKNDKKNNLTRIAKLA